MFLYGMVWRCEFGDAGYGAFWWFELSELGWVGGVNGMVVWMGIGL